MIIEYQKGNLIDTHLIVSVERRRDFLLQTDNGRIHLMYSPDNEPDDYLLIAYDGGHVETIVMSAEHIDRLYEKIKEDMAVVDGILCELWREWE